jgi:hypothetical protein
MLKVNQMEHHNQRSGILIHTDKDTIYPRNVIATFC